MKDHLVGKHPLIQDYQSIRHVTEQLCQPLAVEDYVVQSQPDVSPPKWHLAHTTWFFETFLLNHFASYQVFHPAFTHLFNSYYQRIGSPYPRVQRGLLSRPTVDDIYRYRQHVDSHLLHFLNDLAPEHKLWSLLTLGLHHEQQHQELLMMDIKHNFSLNPEFCVYQTYKSKPQPRIVTPLLFQEWDGGIVEIGHQGKDFCFDNELPRHPVILNPFAIATRLITNAEYNEFIVAGGYQQPEWWLSDGWDMVVKHQWKAPLYWQEHHHRWYVFTLNGLKELDYNEPVVHVSYYEADAFARWKGARLPKEAEWEHYVSQGGITPDTGNFLENKIYHPQANQKSADQQFFGDVWEWTSSAYDAYPGYAPVSGALGEYNGKFMSNQMVLKGGCCVTPKSHIRPTYRNFFQPDKRWQFSGIRLAKDL